MNLSWCLVNCSFELRQRWCNQIMNESPDACGVVAEVFKHISANFAAKIFHLHSVCFQMAISLRAGDGLCLQCWRNTARRHRSRTFGRLFLYDCSTKFLRTWYCKEYGHVWRDATQKNNMVSVFGVWNNICLRQICCSNRPWRLTFQCGYWAFSVHLSKNIGWKKLGCLVVSFVRTRSVNSYVKNFSESIFQSHLLFSNQRRHVTRMRA